MKKATLAMLLSVSFVFGAACFGERQNRSAKESRLWHAPPAARSWQNPYEGQPDAVRAGQKLFRRYCAECHGQDAQGSDRAPDLHSAVRDAAPGELVWFLKNGDLPAGMPSWSRLPDQQRWQIVTFLRTLR